MIYLSFFSISDFSNSSFFVIFSDKKRIAICIEQHHNSPFFLQQKKQKKQKYDAAKDISRKSLPLVVFLISHTHFPLSF